MKTMGVALAVCAALAVVVACGDSKLPPTLASPAIVASPSEIPSPNSPTAQPSAPAPTTAPQPGGTLFVYTREIRLESMAGRDWATLQVVTFDVGRASEVWAFEFGGPNDFPVTTKLAGRQVVIATETRVIVATLDGGSRRTLFEAGSGNTIKDIAVSRDGKLLAVAIAPTDALRSGGELRVIDIDTGADRLAVAKGARFEGFRGQMWQLAWRDDGSGVLVFGATYSEAWGGLATVFLDGTVRIETADGYGNVSPTGRMRAGVVGNVQCMAIAADRLVIRDLDSGRMTFDISNEGKVYTPWEWAPDGSAFVFIEHPWEGNCESISFGRPKLMLVPATGGSPVPVADLGALHERWYGAALVAAGCDQRNEPVVDRWLNVRLYCYGPGDAPIAMRVGGKDVGMVLHPDVVGFVGR